MKVTLFLNDETITFENVISYETIVFAVSDEIQFILSFGEDKDKTTKVRTYKLSDFIRIRVEK